jgi:dTMP kinase
MFITFDGIDGAGKSTQIALLRDHLSEHGGKVVCFRDPGATQLGESIREILLHREDIPLDMRSEMLLYMASRAQLVAERIRPSLDRGETVICDRFLLANVVYQGSAGGLSVDELWTIGNFATHGLHPDFTIVLDLDVGLGMQRVGSSQDRLEKRGLTYFQKVRRGFLDQHARAGGRSIVIDAEQSAEDVHQAVLAFLEAS